MAKEKRRNWNVDTPAGFSDVKGEPRYWLDAVRNFWARTGLDTDDIELAVIVNYFQNYLKGRPKADESDINDLRSEAKRLRKIIRERIDQKDSMRPSEARHGGRAR